MRLLRVHAAIGNESEKMQAPVAGARMLHGAKQHRMLENLPVLDHQIDARDVHVDDAPGPDVQMSDFAVPHLALRQADKRTAGMDESVGILPQQPVVGRLARKSDGIGLGFGPISPAIENDQYEW